jgi:hypothetical protein
MKDELAEVALGERAQGATSAWRPADAGMADVSLQPIPPYG